ncbi:microcystin-dependent protein [Sphingomonas faeni]|uniref:Microcystin-dependent protein n=1 Tax=Sphingomonas faeni TaxID=185950 RepID=A0A2T5TZK1_9SPHN|nr:tail fiber protein [Sphingomonas faeni]PTW44685.1 microcystin-dependent protein [Sphingomonas faeni]
MTALRLVLTKAGITRFASAQLGDPIDLTIAAIGLTAADFIAAPTLTALPGEFRRVTAVSGIVAGDNTVHIVIQDAEEVTYTVRGFGLILADGTLLAAYGQPTPIVEKPLAGTLYLPLDLAFPTTAINSLTFGSTNFLNPAATTTKKGVVELATKTEGLAGEDPLRVAPVAVVRAMLEQHVPTGSILQWFGAVDSVPKGWAICDGSVVDRGDGKGQITTPDMRGRVAVGATMDAPAGTKFGATSKDLNTGSAGAHTPIATVAVENASTSSTVTTTTRNVDAGGSANNVVTSVTLNDPMHTHVARATVDAVPAHDHTVTVDVTQPSLSLHYIMKI